MITSLRACARCSTLLQPAFSGLRCPLFGGCGRRLFHDRLSTQRIAKFRMAQRRAGGQPLAFGLLAPEMHVGRRNLRNKST